MQALGALGLGLLIMAGCLLAFFLIAAFMFVGCVALDDLLLLGDAYHALVYLLDTVYWVHRIDESKTTGWTKQKSS
jgi:hypothetical protein